MIKYLPSFIIRALIASAIVVNLASARVFNNPDYDHSGISFFWGVIEFTPESDLFLCKGNYDFALNKLWINPLSDILPDSFFEDC